MMSPRRLIGRALVWFVKDAWHLPGRPRLSSEQEAQWDKDFRAAMTRAFWGNISDARVDEILAEVAERQRARALTTRSDAGAA